MLSDVIAGSLPPNYLIMSKKFEINCSFVFKLWFIGEVYYPDFTTLDIFKGEPFLVFWPLGDF